MMARYVSNSPYDASSSNMATASNSSPDMSGRRTFAMVASMSPFGSTMVRSASVMRSSEIFDSPGRYLRSFKVSIKSNMV